MLASRASSQRSDLRAISLRSDAPRPGRTQGRPRPLAVLGTLLVVVLVPPDGPAGTSTAPATVDVVVAGGTPAAVAAALAAASAGRSVLLADFGRGLGDVLTRARLNTLDLHRGPDGQVFQEGLFAVLHAHLGVTFHPEEAERLLQRLARRPGIHYRPGTRVVRVRTTGNPHPEAPAEPARPGTPPAGTAPPRLALLVARPEGVAVVQADVLVDATPDADLAIALGAPFTVGREESGLDRRTQPATLLFRVARLDWPGLHRHLARVDRPQGRGGVYRGAYWGFGRLVRAYRDPDPRIHAFDLNLGRLPDDTAWVNALHVYGVDGTDAASRAAGRARALAALPRFVAFLRRAVPGWGAAVVVEVAPELYVRETRHVQGVYRLRAADILEGRRFWDGVARGSYPIDLHPYLPEEVNPFAPRRRLYTVPLRSLVPQRVDGVLVASRSLSASYQAAGSVRVVATTVAVGEAAGMAAAVAAMADRSPRALLRRRDLVREVQHRLARFRADLARAAVRERDPPGAERPASPYPPE